MLFSYPWLRIRSAFLLSPLFWRTLPVVASTLPPGLGFSHVGSFLRAKRMMESDPLLFRRFFFGLPLLCPSGSCRLALSHVYWPQFSLGLGRLGGLRLSFKEFKHCSNCTRIMFF